MTGNHDDGESDCSGFTSNDSQGLETTHSVKTRIENHEVDVLAIDATEAFFGRISF
jgi:hypothetical protein